jgi:hypothetical protein
MPTEAKSEISKLFEEEGLELVGVRSRLDRTTFKFRKDKLDPLRLANAGRKLSDHFYDRHGIRIGFGARYGNLSVVGMPRQNSAKVWEIVAKSMGPKKPQISQILRTHKLTAAAFRNSKDRRELFFTYDKAGLSSEQREQIRQSVQKEMLRQNIPIKAFPSTAEPKIVFGRDELQKLGIIRIIGDQRVLVHLISLLKQTPNGTLKNKLNQKSNDQDGS